MVRISFPWACIANTKQERMASPSMMTVHAPHSPFPHAFFVPVSPISSRKTSSKVQLGLAKISYSKPFTFNLICVFNGRPPHPHKESILPPSQPPSLCCQGKKLKISLQPGVVPPGLLLKTEPLPIVNHPLLQPLGIKGLKLHPPHTQR